MHPSRHGGFGLLLRRPPIEDGESLPSWLARLEESNGYNRQPGLLMSLLLGSQRAPDRLGDRPGYARRPETYRRLETLTGATATDLWAATIHRFAPTLTAPGRTAMALALSDGVTLPLLDTGSQQKRPRAESRGAFCPRCLAEAAYHRLL